MLVEIPERPIVSRTFVGLVASRAEPVDPENTAWTVYIDGNDVLEAVAEDLTRLRNRVDAVFTLNGTRHEAGPYNLSVSKGEPYSNCADGCCPAGEEPYIILNRWDPDEYDVLGALCALHGQDATLTYQLIGLVMPMVTVTLAHHLTRVVGWTTDLNGGEEHHVPGDQIRVPLREAKDLARGGRIITEHIAAVNDLARKKEYAR